jgi:hypothetical protein
MLSVLSALEMSAGLNTVRFECRMNLRASWTTSWIRYSTSIVSCLAASAEMFWMPSESATSLTMSVENKGLAMALVASLVGSTCAGNHLLDGDGTMSAQ